MSGCSQMNSATTSKTLARKALALAFSAAALLAAPAAQAGLWTDGEDYTGPFIDLASRIDLGNGLPSDAAVQATYGYTYGPVDLPGMVFTRSSGATNSGQGAVLGQGDYDLGRNGSLGGAAVYAGLDSLTGFMDFRLTGGPVSQFGAWVNYYGGLHYDSEGGNSAPFIAALGADGQVLESWDLSARAPISTPDGFNQFAFRGISRDSADIFGLRLGNAYIVAAGSADGGVPAAPVAPVPEPSTYALMLAGLGFVAWQARRRKQSSLD
jgi:PEP-CTERM motif